MSRRNRGKGPELLVPGDGPPVPLLIVCAVESWERIRDWLEGLGLNVKLLVWVPA